MHSLCLFGDEFELRLTRSFKFTFPRSIWEQGGEFEFGLHFLKQTGFWRGEFEEGGEFQL